MRDRFDKIHPDIKAEEENQKEPLGEGFKDRYDLHKRMEEAMEKADMVQLQPVQPVQEQPPENKRSRVISGLVSILLLVLLAFCRQMQRSNHSLFEEPYPIRVGDVTVIPGETTVEALSNAGYELSDYDNEKWNTEEGGFYYPETVDVTVDADPNTHYMMVLLKEGHVCASLQIYNWTGGAIPVKDWTIGMVQISSYQEGAQQAALVNIPFSELTQERVTQSIEARPTSTDNGICVWKNGAYWMSIEFEDDTTVMSIRSEYGPY